MKLLDAEDILELHAQQIELWGGDPGVLSYESLESAVFAPHNVLAYEDGDAVDCAAAIGWHLWSNHAFCDGNKRVGAIACDITLSYNGLETPDTEEFNAGFIKAMLAIANHAATRQDLAAFLRNYL